MKNEILTNDNLDEDSEINLRPSRLEEYIGQSDNKEMLNVYIQAALKRTEALDHVLLYGAPGLGKTTLAGIIANELDVNFKITSGPAIEKSGDLAAILSSLGPGDVLFIDEIHRLPRFVEELLYAAMEDYAIDIIIGSEGKSRSIRIDLPPFTLIGATTRFGDLSAPLRDRFGIVMRLSYYDSLELSQIIHRTSRVYETDIDHEAVIELARRSRGTPRIANRLFRRVRDFALIQGNGKIDFPITKYALLKLGIDENGLGESDKLYLRGIINRFQGGPVGLESISATIGEEATTVEDVYEPYLLQEGYIRRTSRGRIATKKGYHAIGKEYLDVGVKI